VTLTDVPQSGRAPLLKAYMSKRAFSRSPEQSARLYFGLAPDAAMGEIEAIAGRYPVFRVEYD